VSRPGPLAAGLLVVSALGVAAGADATPPAEPVGELRFEGLTVFEVDEVRPLFDLAEGDVYDDSKIRKGCDRLREMYGRRGYLQWSATTRRDPDPVRKRVRVVVVVQEGPRYVVGNIRFTGNRGTRDKVLRREVLLNEGEALDAELLRQSVRRLNQLAHLEPIAQPLELVPGAAEDTLDVTFRVKERQGAGWSFGGGTSDTEGTFLNGSLSNTNFLGLGETVEVAAQGGPLVRDYRLSFTEPYVAGRPISAGVSAWSRKLSYETDPAQGIQGYREQRTGAGLTASAPLGKWTRFSLGYSYEDVALEGSGRRHESTLHPSLQRNTIDDPFLPQRGTRLSLEVPVTGGPLGGSLDLARLDLEAVAYIPHTSRSGFGFRAAGGMVLPFGETGTIPFDRSLLLGGETQLRGYDIRSVGPRDASGQLVGGDKYVLLNAEYHVDVVKPLRLSWFFDAGQAYASGEAVDLRRLRTSTGIEARITVPVLKLPLRLIYAVNPNRDPWQPDHGFRLAIGGAF
jgi:outer membrane protein insertion porin family